MEQQIISLIESYNKLIDSNTNLTVAVNKSMDQAIKSINSQKELLKYCGELYVLLEGKTNKTPIEEVCINKIHKLITHSELKK